MADIALCVASGPSLLAQDIAAVRPIADVTICVNDAWQLCHDADYLFAADRRWWRHHYKAVQREFSGQLLTSNEWAYADWKIPMMRVEGKNSGIKAMRVALRLGARKMYLLGYDFCRGADDEKHFFGDHPHPLPNTCVKTFGAWVDEMQAFAAGLSGVEVVNLSRRTAIDCFPRAVLA